MFLCCCCCCFHLTKTLTFIETKDELTQAPSIRFWYSFSFEMFFGSLFTSTTSSAENQPQFMESVSRRPYLHYCILYAFFPAGRSCLTEHARKRPGRELHIGSERGLDYSVWSGVRHNERRSKRNPRCSMNKWISIRALQWTLCYILEVFYESSSIIAHLYDDVTRAVHHGCCIAKISNRGGLSMSHLL